MLQLLLKVTPFNGPTNAQAVAAQAQQPDLNWANIIVELCLVSVFISLLSVQLIHSQYSHLPVIYYFLALAISFAFSCFLISTFIHSNCPTKAQVFHRLGLFYGVTVFLISIGIPFLAWFKSTICVIYVLSWLTILLCNHFYAW